MNVNRCKYHIECLNSALCHACRDLKLLKLPEEKKRKKLGGGKRKGSKFEKKVQKEYDRSMNRSRPTINSGAFWFDKLDLDMDMIKSEIKDTGGKKQFTVKKEWLEEATRETMQSSQMPALIFRFKEDNEIYCTMRMDDVIDMAHRIKELEKKLSQVGGESDK